MIEGLDPTKVVACALRAQSTWLHFVTLAGFVFACWSVSPGRITVKQRRKESPA